MESNWTKAEFNNFGKLQGLTGELVRQANESLASELSISLSAFLRGSFAVTYQGSAETPFGDLPLEDNKSCVALALIGPSERKLIVELEHSALFPLLGIALGAKAGSFPLPERKPTEIELQVVQLLFRMIVSEACRAWLTLVKCPVEPVTLEVEGTPGRMLPATEPVFVARFQLAAEQPLGTLALIAPLDLFSGAEEIDAPNQERAETPGTAEEILELMMPVKVSLDVWLDRSQMRLGDLLGLREGQIVKLDHPVERKVSCSVNGKAGFTGQIVSTGAHRAFLVEDSSA